jgi:uncharacterized paraquat-inducible protein A
MEEPTQCPWCGEVVELQTMRAMGRELVCPRCILNIVEEGQQQYEDDVYGDPESEWQRRSQ